MDFLRCLAPAGNGASRAVPLLPSRFAAEQPLRAVSSPPDTIRDHSEADMPDGAREAPVLSTFDQGIDAPRGEPARTQPRAERQREATPPGHRERASHEHAGPSDRRDRMPPPRPPDETESAGPLSSARAAPGRDRRAAIAPTASLTNPGRPRESDAAPLLRHAHSAVVASAVASPLSAIAVAARSAARADNRPVIHVAIDRIEVRTPAAPSRSAAPVPKRTRAAGVSLSEYLRGAPGRREVKR
jgi:hypothetical protein